ncbi:DUF421 domain-containing protein [Rasiella sp. SM2506]|uniref:DUF421 domain-containing protein n=1 Tax=Rasiella sp. SM2506 TaxID=3423914 RepID=UPI003D7AFE3E
MENWLVANQIIIIKSAASVVAIYLIILLYSRIFGLRTFAKMTSVDFAATIAMGSIFADVIGSTDYSILKGAVALGIIILLQTLYSVGIRKSKFFKKIATNTPLLLMKDGEILNENLAKANVSKGDLYGKLREANVIELKEVRAVVFEVTGDISVLHTRGDEPLAAELLEGVTS